MNILVFGGSGFIGGTTIGLLLEQGYKVTNIDLVEKTFDGFEDNYTYIESDLSKYYSQNLFLTEKFDACINFAAHKAIDESIIDPLKYYDNNIKVMINTLYIASKNNIPRYILSSSASVYKDAIDGNPIKEDWYNYRDAAYPNSKLICEEILEEVCSKLNIIGISLRYFNPVGISKYSVDNSGSLFSNILDCIKYYKKLKIFGNDYNSKDGTCIRDFIDIYDLARAHIFMINSNIDSKYDVFNVGTGTGTTILEVANSFKKYSNSFNFEFAPRRLGDTVGGYADTSKLSALGFKCIRSLDDTVKNMVEELNDRFKRITSK